MEHVSYLYQLDTSPDWFIVKFVSGEVLRLPKTYGPYFPEPNPATRGTQSVRFKIDPECRDVITGFYRLDHSIWFYITTTGRRYLVSLNHMKEIHRFIAGKSREFKGECTGCQKGSSSRRLQE